MFREHKERRASVLRIFTTLPSAYVYWAIYIRGFTFDFVALSRLFFPRVDYIIRRLLFIINTERRDNSRCIYKYGEMMLHINLRVIYILSCVLESASAIDSLRVSVIIRKLMRWNERKEG